MSKRQNEQFIFDAFLRVRPDFACGRIVSVSQPDDENDFPDILCTMESDKKLGIELGEWLNQKEMAHGKAVERTKESILCAIGPQGTNVCDNILCVWLYPEPKARVKPADQSNFRKEILDLGTRCRSEVARAEVLAHVVWLHSI